MKISKLLFSIIILLSVNSTVIAQTDYLGSASKITGHPRLLVLKGEEANIKNTIASNILLAGIHQQILAECNKLLPVKPVERIKTGRRLLDKSREALRRIFYLSYAWRMTQEKKYLERGEQELLAVAGFSDWNPSHFLDVAEMTMAVAIGYDWLYDGLSPSSRSIIKEAILTKGLAPSMDNKNNSWLKATHNWNQVCNAGMAYGAMAIYDEQPELSRTIINRSIETIKLPMQQYAPGGGYAEGYGYWGYGTSYNVMFLAAIQKLFHQDFGLTHLPGFLQTAGFMENMTCPSGDCFNFSDSGLKGELQPAMFWFAGILKDPSLLWVERARLLDKKIKNNGRNRMLPALMIWSSGIDMQAIHPPKELMWAGGGKTPVALMRTSFTDTNAIYVALKGGTASTNHAHMDIGSFIMEADGVRWAMDFGTENYTAIEAKGVDLWNMKQNSARWQIFRYNNKAHNTLTIDDSLQKVDGKAAIASFSNDPMFMNAITGLTDIYPGQVSKANRGIAIIDKVYVLVRDEIEPRSKDISVRWNMLTPAQVKIISNTRAELTSNGKKLILEVKEPANIILKTWSTNPFKDYETANPGTVFVGFEVVLPAKSTTAITVLLIPEKSAKMVNQKIFPLAQWPKK